MNKDWRESDKAKEFLISLLQRSGVPLETRTIRAVETFCQRYQGSPLQALSLGPMLWRQDGQEDLQAHREIDAGALFRQMLSFDNARVPIQAYVSIEAKYREGLEWFAFVTPQSARLPVCSNAVYSEKVEEIHGRAASMFRISRMAAVNTSNGIGDPSKLKGSDEHVTQNVCGAAVDFISHASQGGAGVSAGFTEFSGMGSLVEAFEQSLREPDEWRDELPDFLRKIAVATHNEYHEEVRAPNPVVLRFFVPVLCVNGRINRVEMDDDGAIIDICPAEYAITGERLPKWPIRDIFLNPSTHLPLIVTNPDGIGSALQMIYDHIGVVRDAFLVEGASGSLGASALEVALSTAILEKRGIRMRAF